LRRLFASRKPPRVDAQSIGRSDAQSRPATVSHGGNAAEPEIHTTAGTRSWGPRTNPSTRCRSVFRGSIRIRQQAFSALDGVPANVLRQGYDESVYDERGDQ
jgi:hypothetical protein